MRGRKHVRHHAKSGGHDGRNPNSHNAASPQQVGTAQRMQVFRRASLIRPIFRFGNESVIEPRRTGAFGCSPPCRPTVAAGALPNPSVNLTRYGRPCKPGPRHLYYRREPGLQALPTRAGYLER
jgi:hypothetical protein